MTVTISPSILSDGQRGNCGCVTHPISDPRPHECHTMASQCASYVAQRESGVQATDGRYASTYKMMHCHMTPTSPPEQVTEFPPQRAEVYPGSVFSPRPSLQQDSFATSLRKYPSLAPDRSSEIVEQLINFTQAKNTSKISKNHLSPTRHIDSDQSNQTFCLVESSSRNTAVKSVRGYEPEVHIRPKRLEESPTRERPKNTRSHDSDAIESWKRSTFCRTNDVRYLRNVSRKFREGIRSLSAQANSEPERLNPKEKCDSANLNQRKPAVQWIAIPLTPTPSKIKDPVDSEYHQFEQNNIDLTSIVQTKLTLTDMTVQTVISNTAINNERKNKFSCKRRSKSEEEVKNLTNCKSIQGFHNTSCSKARCSHKTHRYNRSFRALLKLAKNVEKYSKYDEAKSLAETNKTFKCLSVSKICYAKIARNRIVDEDVIVEVLEDWVNLIPLKINNPYERQIVKEYVRYNLFDLIKKSFWYVQLEGRYNLDKLKCDIIDRLEFIPLEIKGNKKLILQKLAHNLLTKIKYSGYRKLNYYKIQSDDIHTKYNCVFQRYIAPTENEIRKFISHELELIEQNSDLNLNEQKYKDMEEDLVDVAMIAVEVLRCGSENHIKKDIAELLSDYGISEKRAFYCTNILVKHLKDTFIYNIYTDKVKTDTIIVLPNYQNVYHKPNLNGSDLTVKSITDDEITANLEHYMNELCKLIDEWLSSLHLPQTQDSELRRIVVNDLASDIVDRYKYLHLNTEQKISNETELEHLKYQIFKWIKKLVGEDNLEPLKHAMELMSRIRQIHVPILSKTANKSLKYDTTYDDISKHHVPCQNIICNTNMVQTNATQSSDKNSMNATQTPNLSIPEYKSNNAPVSRTIPCGPNITVNNSKSTEQLEAEYERFVEDWVRRIPIEISSEGEIDITEKARVGIYNGLWKIVSKLNCDPATYYNRFLYEDLLDDAIDDLLDCLPQTTVLQSRRHILKVEFIEKTVDINDKIKEIEESSFRNKVMRNLVTNLRKQGITENRGDDPIKLHEDLQLIKIVEDYLLSVRFRDEDKIKSEVYKKKLMKEVENFVRDLKKNHSKELKDIDVSSYKADIVNILQKIPIPSENTMKQEADDVLLGIEIEQWYRDLPIVPNDDYTEQYRRRRQRDILTKKIKELEANDESSENALKNEVSRFLEKAPLKEGESLNINFMVDELVNRIKNKYETDLSNKKPILQAAENYDDFSKNVPLCSSLIATPTRKNTLSLPDDNTMRYLAQKSQCEKTCVGQQAKNMVGTHQGSNTINSINNRNRVVIREPPSYRVFDEERPISSSFKEQSNQQWHTIEESQLATTCKEHISMCSLPQYVSSIPGDELNTQRRGQDCCQKALAQLALENNAEPSYYPSAGTSRGIKTDKGILGISQVAGPSGYKPSYSEYALNDSNQDQRPSPIQFRRPSNVSFQDKYFERKEPSPESFSTKCSIECQTEKTLFRNQPPDEIDYSMQGKVCRAIDTPDFQENELIFASTPQQTKCPSIPSVPSKKRANLAITENDNVRKRLDLDNTDDDDVPCRCIENFWKKRQNSKHYPCENSDRYPLYLPLFFPYPYPTYH
ncbi:unnamed protein product, partial [Brenthis ino]